MKLRLFLALSLLANAGLVAAFFATKPAPVPIAPPDSTARPASAPSPHQRVSRSTVEITTNDFNWASLESQDYREYIANLRAVGVPEETIRDIIIADVNKLYAGRIAALYPSPKDYKFWRVEDRSLRNEEREREQKRRELGREKQALIRELLGVDYEDELAKWNGRPDESDWRYGFLNADKRKQLEALQDKFQEQERVLSREGGGRDPERRAKLAALRTQREAEMAQLLGPEDYEQYQFRNSWTARNMREQLASFQPAEEEFRQIFQARKAFDDQYAFNRDGGDEASREQRRLAQQQLEASLKGILGEQRYHDYQLAQDDRFRELHDFGQQQNLSRETIDSVYDMRRTAEQARRQIESDRSMAPDVRQAALAALAEETTRSVSQALGDAAWKDYQRRDGRWLSRLGPTANERNPNGARNADGGRESRGRSSRQ